MSKFDDFIVELCPDGMEYRRLGGTNGICEVLPSGIDKVLDENERPVKLCNYMDVYNNQYITDALIAGFMNGSVNDSEYQKFVLRAGQVLLTKDSETKEDIAQSAYVCSDFDDVVCGYHLAALTPKSDIDGKYLNYALQSHDLRKYFWKMTNGVSRFGLKLKSIEDALIPVPPLPVQQEIVRILDKLTTLETELEAKLEVELEARKKQYNYYRDELLTFSNDVGRKTLGEIATDMYRGSGIKRDQVTETGTPCVRYGEIYTTYNIWFDSCVSHTDAKDISSKKYFEHGDILFAITGESVGEIAKSCVYVGHEKCLAGGDIVVMKHNETPKYLAYALSTTDAQMQKSKGKVKSKVVHSSVPALKAIEIPVPPREEQERIVAILDRFDALVNDITQGLPAEIEARRKQYEYYRDKLLTFKEVGA